MAPLARAVGYPPGCGAMPPGATLDTRGNSLTTESTTDGAGQATGAGDPAGDAGTNGQQPPPGEGAQSDSETSNGQQGAAGDPNGESSSDGGSETLGDAGQKALRAERDARRAAEARARETQQQLDELKRQQMSDTDRQLHDARVEGAQAGARMLARGAVIAAASKTFADPEDAVVALGDKLTGYVDLETEQVDSDAIAADLSDLLERKPHWKRTEAAPPPPGGADHSTGDGTSGASDVEQWNQSIRQQAAR